MFCLKLLNWNPRSVAQKQPKIIDFLQSNEIDVACLSQIHPQPNKNVTLPHHTIVQLDTISHQQGGSVAIATKRGLQYRLLPDFWLSCIEAVGIELMSSDDPIIIIAAYCTTQCRDSAP